MKLSRTNTRCSRPIGRRQFEGLHNSVFETRHNEYVIRGKTRTRLLLILRTSTKPASFAAVTNGNVAIAALPERYCLTNTMASDTDVG